MAHLAMSHLTQHVCLVLVATLLLGLTLLNPCSSLCQALAHRPRYRSYPPFRHRPYPLWEHDKKANSTLLPSPFPSWMPLLYPSLTPLPPRSDGPPHRASTQEAPPCSHITVELEPSVSQAVCHEESLNWTQRRSIHREAASTSVGLLRPWAGPLPPPRASHRGYVPLRPVRRTTWRLAWPNIAGHLPPVCAAVDRSPGELPVLPAAPNHFPTMPRPSSTHFTTTSPLAVTGFGRSRRRHGHEAAPPLSPIVGCQPCCVQPIGWARLEAKSGCGPSAQCPLWISIQVKLNNFKCGSNLLKFVVIQINLIKRWNQLYYLNTISFYRTKL
jgi:hypothetical protein